MRWLLRVCTKCGRYTIMQENCPVCGSKTRVPHPPRFSPEDKYVAYRYRMKLLAGSLSVGEESKR